MKKRYIESTVILLALILAGCQEIPPPPTPVSNTSQALQSNPTPTAIAESGQQDLSETHKATSMWGDVWCNLEGPAGNLASGKVTTGLDAIIEGSNAEQVKVETPNGKTIIIQPFSDVPYGQKGRFYGMVDGPPLAGTYTFTALDAKGMPVTGGTATNVYLGGREPDPPTNVQAEVVEAGIQVTWDPSPNIPGAFEPGSSPPTGYYTIYFIQDTGGVLYAWASNEAALFSTSHLIPYRHKDFKTGDAGMALDEMKNGAYFLRMYTFSLEPQPAVGQHAECIAYDPSQEIRVAIQADQVHIEP